MACFKNPWPTFKSSGAKKIQQHSPHNRQWKGLSWLQYECSFSSFHAADLIHIQFRLNIFTWSDYDFHWLNKLPKILNKIDIACVNIWKELVEHEIRCVKWAPTTLKPQVNRQSFSCTIVREGATEYLLAPENNMKVGQGFYKHARPWFVGVGVWYWT